MEAFDAFIKGFKPAVLCSRLYESEAIEKLLCMNYPHVLQYELEDFDKPGEIYDIGILFFQNEQLKNEYLSKREKIKENSREDIILLGEVLGFPPIACKFFADAWENEELDHKRAAFRYHGIVFAGNIDDAEEIAKWLWENVPAPPVAVEVEYKKEKRWIEPSVQSSFPFVFKWVRVL